MLLGTKKLCPTKGCAVLFGFQRTGGGYRESPLTFHAEKLRGLQPSFFNFLKDFCLRHKEKAPEIAVPIQLGIHGQNVGVACRLSERDLLASPLSGK